MSVVIKDIEMPKSCGNCPLYYEPSYDENDEPCATCLVVKDNSPSGCGYKEIDGIDQTKEKMSWCPLVELPEKHGDLIDREKLKKSVLEWLPPDPCGIEEKEYPFETDICISMMMEIDDASVIIAAED